MGNIEPGKEYHIALGKGDVGKYVILPGDPGRVPKIAKYLDDAKEIAFNREYRTFTGYVDGVKVSVCSTGIGGPSAAIAIEELARCGAEVFIRVGTCGSLQKEVGLGDLCIATGAIREEGTTRQYVPLSYPAVADFEVTMALKEAAEKLNHKSHLGIAHCKDAFYIEGDKNAPMAEDNERLWKIWEKSNVLVTEMEAAALYVVCSIKKLKAGDVLAVIGLTYNDEPIVKKVGVEAAIETAVEAIRILEKNKK